MGLGILEDRNLERVPGTSLLNDVLGSDQDVEHIPSPDKTSLKHDPTGKIVLVPQPSDHPDDPFNWPRWKKELFMLTIAYGTGCVGAIGPLLTSAMAPLAVEFDVSMQRFTLGLQGTMLICIACSGLVWNPLAVKVGKRPIYLLSTLGLAVTCFWGGASKSFGSLTAARAVQGLMMSPFECLIPASIADVWFVHERGFRSAMFNLGIVGGINLASPLAGLVIQYGSFRICLHAMGGAFTLMLILVFLFMPETAFHRSAALDIDGGEKSETVIEHVEDKVESALTDANATPSSKPTSIQLEDPQPTTVTHVDRQDGALSGQRQPYLKDLLPYSGYWDASPFWSTMVRPFYTMGSPIVLWASFMLTAIVSWLVLISFVLSQIFSAPPYSFSVSGVGATNVSSFVATILGTAAAGPVIDGLIKHLSRRNGGIYEPEFRLPIMVAFAACTGVGFFAWGQSISNRDPWPVPIVVCLGLINIGAQLGATGVTAYVVDSHRQHAAECFASMNLLKNLFAFGLSFFSNDWIANQGVRYAFFTVGGITIGATLTTIPMYIYGKRARSFVWRHNLLDRA